MGHRLWRVPRPTPPQPSLWVQEEVGKDWAALYVVPGTPIDGSPRRESSLTARLGTPDSRAGQGRALSPGRGSSPQRVRPYSPAPFSTESSPRSARPPIRPHSPAELITSRGSTPLTGADRPSSPKAAVVIPLRMRPSSGSKTVIYTKEVAEALTNNGGQLSPRSQAEKEKFAIEAVRGGRKVARVERLRRDWGCQTDSAELLLQQPTHFDSMDQQVPGMWAVDGCERSGFWGGGGGWGAGDALELAGGCWGGGGRCESGCQSGSGARSGGYETVGAPLGRDAIDGKGPQRRPQRRLDRRLEEVAKAVGGVTVGYKCH